MDEGVFKSGETDRRTDEQTETDRGGRRKETGEWERQIDRQTDRQTDRDRQGRKT